MKVYYSSDLHLEFMDQESSEVLEELYKGVSGDVLVLAGDIHVNNEYSINELLKKSFNNLNFEHLIFVPGNHEYYNGDIIKDNEYFSSLKENNIHILNPGCVKIKDVCFHGATLWTDFNFGNLYAMEQARKGMNDYHIIKYDGKKLKPKDILNEFKKDLKFLKQSIDHSVFELNHKNVVITHHAPSYSSVAEQFRGDSLNSCFVSELDIWIKQFSFLQYWIHGHVHSNFDYKIWDTNVVCNSYGYSKRENMEFNVNNFFEV